jgi:iron-sulfur cluster repair protein YtfE (RIC family)
LKRNIVHSALEADHRELDFLLEAVRRSLETGDAYEVYKRLDLFWARLAVHIRAEHVVLFPALEEHAADRAETEDLLARLRSDHDLFMTELGRAIKALRPVLNFGNDAETIQIVRSHLEGVKVRLAEHNEIEEARVYGRVSKFEPAVLEEVHAAVMTQLNKMPRRFSQSG